MFFSITPEATISSAPLNINLYEIASFAVATKFTTPLPSPFGLLASLPTISTEISRLVGEVTSPNS
jgi:hypothetical protein